MVLSVYEDTFYLISSIFFLRLVCAAVSFFFSVSLSTFVSNRVLRKKKLGNVVLMTVFDNNQEAKSSVKTERGGVGVYGSILIRSPRYSRSTEACCFETRY